MAKCNCAAMNVYLRTITAYVLEPGQRHRCKGFIDLIQVNVGYFHARTLKRAVGCEQWFFQHDHRVTRCHRQVDDPRARRQAMFFQRLFRYDQNRRCAVADLAGVGGGNAPAFLKQLHARQAFKGRVIADAFVFIVDELALWRIDFHADDFIGKCTALRGRNRLLMRFQRELVEVFAGKAIFFDQHFSAHELAEHDAGIGFFQTWAFVGAHAFFFEQHGCRTHRHARHAFDTSGKHNVLRA